MKRSGKKRAEATAPKKVSIKASVKPSRAGAPDQDSILGKKEFKSPKGKVYKIIKTNEMDAYDKPEEPKNLRK